MLNVSPVELLVVLTLGLIVLGPQKLPEVARQAGRLLTELRRMANGFQQEIRDAVSLDGDPTSASSPGQRIGAPPPLASPAPTDPAAPDGASAAEPSAAREAGHGSGDARAVDPTNSGDRPPPDEPTES